MSFHDPFPANISNAVLSRNQVVMCDDSEMTTKHFNKLMFNLMRILIFDPVPLPAFYNKYLVQLNNNLVRNLKRDFWNYNICFEIVETLETHSGKHLYLPVLSRFVNLTHISEFITENNLLDASPDHYGVRMVATHFVSDCFLYVVLGNEVYQDSEKLSRGVNMVEDNNSLATGNVMLKPLSYFSCGASSLSATSNENMHPVDTHIPDKLHDNVPQSLLHLSQKCLLFWLPSMKRIQAQDLIELMQSAYNFHNENPDMLFKQEEEDEED